MKWYRFFKSSDDGTTVTVDPSVTTFAIPKISLTGDGTTGTTGSAIKIGTTLVPIALNTAGQSGIKTFFSTTATSDTTYGMYMRLDANAAVSEAIAGRFKTLLTVASATNAHGGHTTLELDTSAGNVTGLGTGFRGNLVVANRAVAAGTYYGVLAEIYALGNTTALPAASNACLGINLQPGTAIDLVGNAISFSGTDGDGKMIYTHAPSTLEGSVRILVNGVAKYLPYYTTK